MSSDEIKVLNKDPKYSLRYDVELTDFKIELEKMAAKKKYREHEMAMEIKKKNILAGIVAPCEAKNNNELNDHESELNGLWEKERQNLVFDPLINRIDFRRRRPTDYKHNKRIFLPKAASLDVEFDCEKRRRLFIKCLEDLKKERDIYENENKRAGSEDVKDTVNETGTHDRKKIDNFSKSEMRGFKSLMKRVSDGELILTTTDKSSRMAVLTKEEYMRSGEVHTSKDTEISWKDISYLQSQINNHTWWASKVVGNCKDTDPERMGKNIMEHGYQVPELFLLIKDHKKWREEDNKPVPSRPVMSGNCCPNTHLSELVSELVEPITTRLGGAEIYSSEEALNKFTCLNKRIRSDRSWLSSAESNILEKIGYFRTSNSLCTVEEEVKNEKESVNKTGGDHKDLNIYLEDQNDGPETDVEYMNETGEANDSLIDTLADLIESGCTRTQHNSSSGGHQLNRVPEINPGNRGEQKKITDFWGESNLTNENSVFSGIKLTRHTRIKYMEVMRDQLKSKADRSESFMEKLELDVHSSVLWGRCFDLQQELDGADLTIHPAADSDTYQTPPLQNGDEKPILLGADVEALYPNMDKIVTGQLMYKAVMECDIDFSGFDYERLSVYLLLVLGASVMTKCGLGDCIPSRRDTRTNARSLGAKCNKDMGEWRHKSYNFTVMKKRMMVGRLLQVLTTVLMSSSCYSFGGKLYRQKGGAGIGKRGSACVAKCVMSLWDKLWANKQMLHGLSVALLVRYIDDIRIYLHPINNGWSWDGKKWSFDPEHDDGLTYEERTRRGILQTLNSTLDSINLTIESESDYQSGMLPTLDFQTRVRDDWEVEFTFYTKPMASTLVIQNGTALPKQTIFSSLRQDLIRRLCSISCHRREIDEIKVVEDFIQCLSDSGHQYSFSKSVILQGLTRYTYMLERDGMDPEVKKRFNPLYRERLYNF